MHLFAFVSHVFEFLVGISYPLSCFAHSGCPENLADRFNFFSPHFWCLCYFWILQISCRKKESKSWSKKGCPVAPNFCDFFFLQPSGYQFLVCRLYMAIFLLKSATTISYGCGRYGGGGGT